MLEATIAVLLYAGAAGEHGEGSQWQCDRLDNTCHQPRLPLYTPMQCPLDGPPKKVSWLLDDKSPRPRIGITVDGEHVRG